MPRDDLIVIRAPAGFGKTTLLAQWAAAESAGGKDVHWLSADGQRSSDLISAIEEIILERKTDAAPLTVVIDDCPSLDEATVQEFGKLASSLPRLRTAVATRHQTPTPEERYLSATDLGFADEETRHLFELCGVKDEDFVGQVIADFGDWPLAVRAALDGRLAQMAPGLAAGSLASGVYSSLDSESARRVLTAAAHVEKSRQAPLQQALGLPEEEMALAVAELIQSGAVSQGADELGNYFSVRPGLRTFFMQLFRANTGSRTELEALHAIAEAPTDPVTSIEVLLRLEEWEAAENVGLQHLSAILEDEHRALLAVRGVSLEWLQLHPVLLMIRLILERSAEQVPISAVEQIAGRLHGALEERMRGADPDTYRVLIPMQIAVERMLGMWDSAVDLSWAFLESLEGMSTSEVAEQPSASPIPYAVTALTGVLSGDFDLADRSAKEGLALAAHQENLLEQVHALSLQALSLALQGKAHAAEQKLADVDRLETNLAETPPEFSWADGDLARVFVAYHTGNVDRGMDALDRLLPLIERMEQWPIVVLAESLLACRQHGPEDAFAQMQSRLDARPRGRSVSDFWETILRIRLADLAMWAGRYDYAANRLEEARVFDVSTSAALMYRLSNARLALFRGDYAAAANVGSLAESEDASAHSRSQALLIGGLAEYRLGNADRAEVMLTKASGLLRPETLPVVVSGVPHALLVEAANCLGIGELADASSRIPASCRYLQYGSLTPAELKVLKGLAMGKTMPETAEDLFISLNTLKAHRRSIYTKLHATSRAEAVSRAWRMALL